ncbi:ABC transporter permease subunit [uncultured Thiodictyon sp.]|uniref:ABC transporter permease n=1 Tax=uncultured Thiodictyon sp. TaxID=1846217 RepID=UPI0025F09E88|nr:ABC transporter permease subunit [uncultured Thiodictyon sp.]
MLIWHLVAASLLLGQYALQTTLRMGIALLCSLLFTFVYAKAALRSRRAEQVLIPLLDILQSVPILGFLSITVLWFVQLFPGSLLGPECAAIFAIFTSQAWNMAFSFYYSLRMLPKDLSRVADLFHLSAWQRFWKLEVPYAMPGLVWNAMMSVSGGWFFVVASEAITVSEKTICLPGIGSYIAVAIAQRDLTAVGYAIVAMLSVILLTDQLLFRPVVAWADKFKFEFAESRDAPRSWLLDWLRQARLWGQLMTAPAILWDRLRMLGPRRPAGRRPLRIPLPRLPFWRHIDPWPDWLWLGLLGAAAVASIVLLARFVLTEASDAEVAHVFVLGLYTLARVLILTGLASLIWVPIGVLIGLRPRLAQRMQPLVLFLSAFPANLLFPVVVSFIVAHRLSPDIWLSPLMILGTQWYILFNVIAGAAALPSDLKEAAANLGLRGWLRWRRVLLPAVFPSYLTGGLTASGGAWNASVVAEVASWGTTTLTASGVGAYIAQATVQGDHPRVALGIAVMSLYVVIFNRLIWKRLYAFAQRRLALD